jgi:hypothetical protein
MPAIRSTKTIKGRTVCPVCKAQVPFGEEDLFRLYTAPRMDLVCNGCQHVFHVFLTEPSRPLSVGPEKAAPEPARKADPPFKPIGDKQAAKQPASTSAVPFALAGDPGAPNEAPAGQPFWSSLTRWWKGTP